MMGRSFSRHQSGALDGFGDKHHRVEGFWLGRPQYIPLHETDAQDKPATVSMITQETPTFLEGLSCLEALEI